MSAILFDGEVVHYEVLGRGRPLMFLHGWVGSWRYWIPTMQAASTSFRTYALDLWGFGDTAKKAINYTLNEQARLLEGFLSELGIGKIGLVGHGLGAVVAALFSARHPGLVDRLMTICLPLGEGGINPRLRTTSPEELGEWLLNPGPLTEAARVEAPKADPLAIQTSLEDLHTHEMAELALNLTTPTLMVYGQNDPTHVVPDEALSVDLAEHTHRIVFEDSGHFPMLDEPRKFNRLMADFLALNSGESPRKLQLKEEWKRRVR